MNVDYNEFWSNNKSHSTHPSVRMRNALIIDSLSKLKFSSLIDIGCGDAFLINLLQKSFPNVEYAGMDYSQSIIDEDKNKYQNVHFFHGDISSEKFNYENRFDAVVCSEVLEHLDNWEQAIENLIVSANDEGYIVITTQSGKRHVSDMKVGHMQHFELYELERVLQRKGCKIITSYKKGWPFYNLQKMAYDVSGGFAKDMQSGDLGVSLFGKVIFNITYLLFTLTPKLTKYGPQIFILAQKQPSIL